MTTKETTTLEIGTVYTDPNGQQVGLGGLTDEQVRQQIAEKENMLWQMTSQYNRHGWAGGSVVYQRERTAIYQSLEALRKEAARRLEEQKKKKAVEAA